MQDNHTLLNKSHSEIMMRKIFTVDFSHYGTVARATAS